MRIHYNKVVRIDDTDFVLTRIRTSTPQLATPASHHTVPGTPRDLKFVTSILLQEYRSTLWCSWDCGSRA